MKNNGKNEKSIADFIHILWSGKWVIVITTVVFLLLGLLYAFVIHKDIYSSTASLYVDTNDTSMESVDVYTEYMNSAELMDIVLVDLDMENMSSEEFRNKISISSDAGGSIEVTAEDNNPDRAEEIADVFMKNAVAYITAQVQENAVSDAAKYRDKT